MVGFIPIVLILITLLISPISADTNILSGTPYKFGGGTHNSLVQIDSTHYLNTYQDGVSCLGYAVVLTVNPDGTITKGTRHQITNSCSIDFSLVKIDSTHYINAYFRGDGGYARVLTVNPTDWTITSGTKYKFDKSSSRYNSLVQIDSTHYLNTYKGQSDCLDRTPCTIEDCESENCCARGYAVVLTVNPTDWTITSETRYEFDESSSRYNSLVKIDSTHYINAYEGGGGGYAITLTVNPTDWTITSGTKHKFDINSQQNSLVQIDSTHYINAYRHAYGGGGFGASAVVLTVNPDGSIISGTKHEFESCYLLDTPKISLVQIDSIRYLNTYSCIGEGNSAVILTVNPTDWTITSGTKHNFDGGGYNSLVQMDLTHYLNVCNNHAVVLTLENLESLSAPLINSSGLIIISLIGMLILFFK